MTMLDHVITVRDILMVSTVSIGVLFGISAVIFMFWGWRH